MDFGRSAGVVVVPFAALLATACVSQSAYDEQAEQLKQAQAQVAAQQSQIAKMQAENKWVVAGDLLFPKGGYQLGLNGQAALSQHVPQLRSVQNVKVVVYGFTDNTAGRAGAAAGGHCGQPRPVVAPVRDRRRVSPVAGRQSKYSVRQGFRRHASRGAERYAGRPRAEPPHRNRPRGPRGVICHGWVGPSERCVLRSSGGRLAGWNSMSRLARESRAG